MGLAATAEYAYVNQYADSRAFADRSGAAQTWGGQSAIARRHVNELTYGKSVYPFWRTVTGWYTPCVTGTHPGFDFHLEGIVRVSGFGSTPKAASNQFKELFHTTFQTLFVKQAFEMDADEAEKWNEIRRLVDVEAYRQSLPVISREYGRVASNEPGRWSVRWESGEGRVTIDLQDFPDEFASYKCDQPFEAYVERDQKTMSIRRVFDVKRVPSVKQRPAEDIDSFLEGIPSSRDLPATTLD